jgi:hypothetical protein
MREVRPLLLLVIVLVAAAALASAVVALSSNHDAQSAGPLGPAGNHDWQCLPAKLREPDTFGAELLRNSSHATISIDRVELASARHLIIIGAYLVPGNAGVGTAHGFPPPSSEVREPYWRERGTAPGYRVPPGRWINVVVGLDRTATVGSTAGIEVAYHEGSTHYLLKTNFKVILRGNCLASG